MNGHTPGPWTVREEPMLRQYDDASWEVYWIISSQGSLTAVRRGCTEVTGDMHANARLIAAAPEMYELIDDLSVQMADDPIGDFRSRAKALRAKIDGNT